MRSAKKRRADECVVEEEVGVNDFLDVGEAYTSGEDRNEIHCDQDVRSASAKKIASLAAFGNENDGGLRQDQDFFGQRNYAIVDSSQLNQLLEDKWCPLCGEASLTVKYGDKQGFSRILDLLCENCDYKRSETTSQRQQGSDKKNVCFDINQRMVLLCVELGGGYQTLQKLCAILGMPNMTEGTYARLQKQVCDAEIKSFYSELLPRVVEVVKDAYRSEEPNRDAPQEWNVDDGILSIDVSFDGTWHRRGHASHYGVGVIIDALTGLVIDYHVLSTFCHKCRMKESEELTEAERVAWLEKHHDECLRNHQASSKAMERDAALFLWSNSIERTDFRYR